MLKKVSKKVEFFETFFFFWKLGVRCNIEIDGDHNERELLEPMVPCDKLRVAALLVEICDLPFSALSL